jgi:SAM-dependent methyltransferase
MSRPPAIPAPDDTNVADLNRLYTLEPPGGARPGWKGRLVHPLRQMLYRLFRRQEHFNAALVDHVNRNTPLQVEAHFASVAMIDWMERSFAEAEMSADDLRRHREALLARERRATTAVATLASAQEELRAQVNVLQRAAQGLKREVDRLSAAGVTRAPAAPVPAAALTDAPVDMVPAAVPATVPGAVPPAAAAGAQTDATSDSYKYVGFEDQFRGSQDEIRERLKEYLPIFAGASDVLDMGCGRGEFLALLQAEGVRARGIDVNRAMVDACRDRGLDAVEGDALTYLRSLPDGSLGGLIAAQVVEHLEPRYLSTLLDLAYDKLRPGAAIVLETINPACWVAFFESYIRDITHVRPLHPETLKYLLVASGFDRVDIRFMAPYPEADKLQPLTRPADTTLADWAETINANAHKINRLLFTYLDYAAIGRRP